MDKIDRSNYEIFLIDLMEGQLSHDVEQEVLLFLKENPDIAQEFEGLDEMVLPHMEEKFPLKNKLKHAELPTSELISYENYEAYFARWVDNELTQKERKELLLFLQLHPELSKEFTIFQKAVLKPDTSVAFPDHGALKDIAILSNSFIDAHNYEQVFVEYHEDQLNAVQQAKVLAFIKQYPHTQKSFDLLAKTYLQADTNIVYPNKNELKQKAATRVIPMYRMQRIAVAATIAFVMFFGWMYFNNSQPDVEQMAFVKRPAYDHKWDKLQAQVVEELPEEVAQIHTQVTNYIPKPKDKVIDPVVDLTRPVAMDVPAMEAKQVAFLESEETAVRFDNYYYAPLGEHVDSPSNLWQYATAYAKTYAPYWEGFNEEIQARLNPQDIEYQGVDLWDIAKIGVMSFNGLTENEYRLARRDK